VGNAELSPDARALWFALKLHVTQPSEAASQVIRYLMSRGGGAIADAKEIGMEAGLAESEVSAALGELAMKDVVHMWREEAGKHRMQVNLDFFSPLFGGVA
jgi:predicted transcriptional regulator